MGIWVDYIPRFFQKNMFPLQKITPLTPPIKSNFKETYLIRQSSHEKNQFSKIFIYYTSAVSTDLSMSSSTEKRRSMYQHGLELLWRSTSCLFFLLLTTKILFNLSICKEKFRIKLVKATLEGNNPPILSMRLETIDSTNVTYPDFCIHLIRTNR